MDLFFGALCYALWIYYVVLLVRIILSWVPSLPEPVAPIARFVQALTDPVLAPLRGVVPPIRMGGVALDLSPILVFILIGFILIPLIC